MDVSGAQCNDVLVFFSTGGRCGTDYGCARETFAYRLRDDLDPLRHVRRPENKPPGRGESAKPRGSPGCHGRVDSEAYTTMVQQDVIGVHSFRKQKARYYNIGSVCASREHSERRGAIT